MMPKDAKKQFIKYGLVIVLVTAVLNWVVS